jgi:L-ascorbate metabolism protein UlaG (beta-lactamase superfamily)
MLVHPAIWLAALIYLLFAGLAAAQTSTCLAVADNRDTRRIMPAAFAPGELADDEVGITYVGHSAFRIETPKGVVIVTDYAGYSGEGRLPDVVTMNHAHSSHYTDTPDPGIAHVLRGWNPDGPNPIQHHLQLEDVLIRNVTTDLYYNGALLEKDGNSIFIFEVAGLCIGHLGHLHHKLTPEHIARIGRLDILFVPVDGTYTMSLAGMIELAGQLRASMVIPMHFFSTFTLQRFVAGMAEKFETVMASGNSIKVSLKTLPERPQVMVLSPY